MLVARRLAGWGSASTALRHVLADQAQNPLSEQLGNYVSDVLPWPELRQCHGLRGGENLISLDARWHETDMSRVERRLA